MYFPRKFRMFLLIITFLLCTSILCGCGNASPTVVMQNYINALKAKNYKKAWNCISRVSQEAISGEFAKNKFKEFKDKCEGLLKDETMKTQLLSSTVTSEKLEDSRAFVTIQFTERNGKTDTEIVSLVKEDGKWKIRF